MLPSGGNLGQKEHQWAISLKPERIAAVENRSLLAQSGAALMNLETWFEAYVLPFAELRPSLFPREKVNLAVLVPGDDARSAPGAAQYRGVAGIDNQAF